MYMYNYISLISIIKVILFQLKRKVESLTSVRAWNIHDAQRRFGYVYCLQKRNTDALAREREREGD